MNSITFLRVSLPIRPLPEMARETVLIDTPSCSATSLMVIFLPFSLFSFTTLPPPSFHGHFSLVCALMSKLSIICALRKKFPAGKVKREVKLSLPGDRYLYEIIGLITLFCCSVQSASSLYFKDQISIRRHRPCLFVYDHLQFVNRCAQRFHSWEDI